MYNPSKSNKIVAKMVNKMAIIRDNIFERFGMVEKPREK